MRVSGGVSNLSFSFRGNDAVREAMHTAFLYHAVQAGMTMGIVNAGQLGVYEKIEPGLRERVEDVILARRADATERLLEYAAGVKGGARSTEKDDAWRRGTRAGTPDARAGQRHHQPRGRRHRGSAAEVRHARSKSSRAR